MADEDGSIVAAIFWMFLIFVLLFWAPVIGPLIAGVVGGKSADGVSAAIVAVLLPCVVFGALQFFVAASLTGLPLIGWVAGAGGIVLAMAHIGPLLLGAIIGGIIT